VREAGLDAMELQFVRNVQFNPEKAEEARLEARRSDVLLSVHAPYYINLNSSSDETRRKSEDWLLRSLRAAEAFNAWIVVVHAAVYGEERDKAEPNIIGSLRKVRREAKEESLHAVIGLETMGKRAAWGTLNEIHAIMEAVEGVLPVLDFAHLHARGPRLDRKGLDAILDAVISEPRLHCHLSGIEYTEAGERRHLRLGEGLDHRSVLEALIANGRDSTVICESTSPLEDAQEIRRLLDSGTDKH